MKFEEHGIYEITVENNLLLVDATGPFNEELIISYRKALEAAIKLLEVGKWNQIITVRETSIFTPEAELALSNSLKERKLRGLLRSCVIVGELNSRAIAIKQMSRCYLYAEIENQFFTTFAEAKQWLNSF
jgi:hypothetical protein